MLSKEEEKTFWGYVNKSPEYKKGSGCWVWEGPKDTRGIAKFYCRGKQFSAVRLAYALLKEPLAKGRRIYKTCHDPWCVNPEHMRFIKTVKRARLSDQEVYAIKDAMINAYKPGLGSLLAQRYELSPAMVYAITSGRAYAHVHVPGEGAVVNRRLKVLTPEQKEEIRQKWKAPHPWGYGRILAEEYNVSPVTISKNRKRGLAYG